MSTKKQVRQNAGSESNDGLDYGLLDDSIGIVLQRAFNAAYKYFQEYMGKDFAPGFFSTLYLLRQNPGISQNELAAAIRRDKSTLVPFLNKMEKKGWVVRRVSTSDRRQHQLFLTPKGKRMAEVTTKKVKKLEEEVASELGRGRTQQLLQLLRTVEAIHKNL